MLTPDAGKDEEKLDHSYIAGEVQNDIEKEYSSFL